MKNLEIYKFIKMSKSKMKYEFGDYVKSKLFVKYKVYENDDSFKVVAINIINNKIINEKIFICRL